MQGATADPSALLQGPMIMTADVAAPVPLWLLYEDEVDAWRARQSAQSRSGSASIISRPKSIGCCWRRMRPVAFSWRSAAWASARAHCRCGTRRDSRSACRRAAIDWRKTGAPTTPRNCAWGSPTAAYRFERYRPAKTEAAATIEAPPNADRSFVALAAEALTMARDWINTPASDFGPAQLAAAARELAERHHAGYREWVGEELHARIFRRFTRSAGRARMPRGCSRFAGRRRSRGRCRA